MQLGMGAAALGVTALGGKKLLSWATANEEGDQAKEQQFKLLEPGTASYRNGSHFSSVKGTRKASRIAASQSSSSDSS